MIPPGVESILVDSARYFLQLSLIVIPLFLVASFFVGLAQEYMTPERIEEILRDRDQGSGNVAAATLGAVTPFCSCSSIPLTAGLLQSGAPVGIVLTFLMASPLINEIAVPLLAGLFGLEIMLLYVAVTFTSSVVAGIILGWLLDLEPYIKDLDALDGVGSDFGGPVAADGGVKTVSHRDHIRRAAQGATDMITDMWLYVLFGLSLAAFIRGAVPVSWLQAVLGPSNPLAVPLAVAAGVPLYMDLTAMLPVAAAFVDQGIPIGTVLALLVGVVGISLPELVMLSKMFKRRLLALYIGATVTVGIMVGVLFNYLFV